jgi:hypothetical protein
MPFKQDYLQATGVTDQTYAVEDTAIERIRSLYGTARQGALNQQGAASLWQSFFFPLLPECQHLPQAVEGYDAFAVKQICSLARLLRERNLLRQRTLGDFGIAQKMFNLFIKHHWALDVFPRNTELCLHLPLDKRVLSKLRNCPGTWKTWTRAQDSRDTRRDYRTIQNAFRREWNRLQLFGSPIEMEQFIWYSFDCA